MSEASPLGGTDPGAAIGGPRSDLFDKEVHCTITGLADQQVDGECRVNATADALQLYGSAPNRVLPVVLMFILGFIGTALGLAGGVISETRNTGLIAGLVVGGMAVGMGIGKAVGTAVGKRRPVEVRVPWSEVKSVEWVNSQMVVHWQRGVLSASLFSLESAPGGANLKALVSAIRPHLNPRK